MTDGCSVCGRKPSRRRVRALRNVSGRKPLPRRRVRALRESCREIWCTHRPEQCTFSHRGDVDGKGRIVPREDRRDARFGPVDHRDQTVAGLHHHTTTPRLRKDVGECQCPFLAAEFNTAVPMIEPAKRIDHRTTQRREPAQLNHIPELHFSQRVGATLQDETDWSVTTSQNRAFPTQRDRGI